jgi:NAD-dependent dihydropyrimidine dehydrogenase PreA subunit
MEELRWRVEVLVECQPNIDQQKCTGCQSCVKFCQNGVMQLSVTTQKAWVKQSHSCVEGCRTCARLCAAGAITFSDEEAFISYLRTRLAKIEQSLGLIENPAVKDHWPVNPELTLRQSRRP